MIHVIKDYSNIIINHDGLVVLNNLSYIQAHLILTRLKLPKEDATIIIKRKIYWNWIERFLNRLDDGYYSVEHASLKSVLQSKWDCEIPNEVTDDVIKECGFLNFEEFPGSDESFDDFVLRVSFGSVMGRKSLSLEDIPGLIEQSNTEQWRKSKNIVFLKMQLDQRLNLWQTSVNKNLNFLLDKFLKSSSSLFTELISFSVLKSYKTIGLRLIPDFQVYDSMNLPLEKLKFSDKDISAIINQIEYEINAWGIPNDKETLKEYVSRFSGRIEMEYHKIEELIENNPELLSIALINQLKDKFRLSALREKIESLEKKIPPSFPAMPSMEWTTQKMIDWVVIEYFPYYEWSLASSRNFQILEPLSIIFSDWFYKNFENIKYNSGKMLYNFVPNNFEEFIDLQQMDVVLIVDNLPWFLSGILKNALAKNGYNLGSSSAYLAHLPSVTEYSKKCLLSGSPNYTEITNPTYRKILEEGGWYLFKEKLRLKYYPTLGAFYKEKKLEGCTHFINYLELDDLLHKSEEALGVSHMQAAKNMLDVMIESLLKYINSVTKDIPFRLHIISDHGATFLKPTKDALLSSDYIKTKGLQNTSPRYAVVPGDPNEFLTPDQVSNTYAVSKDVFGIPEHFLLPRGFKSLISINGHVMSHGGLQPEEIVIPHMVFEKAKDGILQPTLTLLNNKFRFANQEISLEIGNPNKEQLSEIYVSIINSNFESDKTTVKHDVLSPKSKDVVTFNGKFKQTSNQFEKENLKFGIRYKFKNSQFSGEINLPIKMISIVETDDLDIFDKF